MKQDNFQSYFDDLSLNIYFFSCRLSDEIAEAEKAFRIKQKQVRFIFLKESNQLTTQQIWTSPLF